MSEDFMKSALERAMERADKIEVSQEQLNEMKYRSKGEEIAATFLKDSGYPLADELNKLDAEAKRYISKAIETILLQNLSLPKKENDVAKNEEVFRGLSALKENKDGLRQAQDQLANLSNYYAQAVKQQYEQLKAHVEQAMGQALQQKTGMPLGTKINVEQTPEFQDNWRQVLGKLDVEYGKALTELKQQIMAMK